MSWTGKHFDYIEDPEDDGIDRVAPYAVLRKFIDACDADHELSVARKKHVSGIRLPDLSRWFRGR